VAAAGKENGITWYDVLGLLPGASADQVKSRYDARVSLLRPEHIAGAPSPVVAAASRARDILDAAQRVLADPANRARYDETVGIRRSGGGLQPHRGYPSEPGWDMPDAFLIGGREGVALLGGLLVVADLLTPHPRPPRRVVVPDVRGLFYSTCSGITGKLGFRITTVRLTEHPMPVDGLVVDQSPRPAARAGRGSVLTVQVWHPPARLTRPRP
jgi:DnaJ domain/PASTA domain